MTLMERIKQNQTAIQTIVTAHNGSNPRVFGSVARGTDTQNSDLDLLIDPGLEMTLFDLGAIKREMSSLLGVNVDVATPDGLPDEFRDRVLQDAQHL